MCFTTPTYGSRMRADDTAYLLDLCDQAIGEPSTRHHAFSWLLDEAGARPQPVDGWWPTRRLVVLIADEPTETLERRLNVLAAYRIEARVLRIDAFESDASGAMRRLPERDEQRVRTELLAPGAALEQRLWFGGALVVGRNDAAHTDDGDEMVDWVELAEDDVFPEIDAEDLFDQPEEPSAPAFDPGWRADALARAALGAAALGRRAFGVAHTGHGVAQTDVEVMAWMALGESRATGEPHSADTEAGLAAALALDAWDVRECVESLAHRMLVEEAVDSEPDARAWSLTDAGAGVVEAWVARLPPLFARWPPETPETDDAIG